MYPKIPDDMKKIPHETASHLLVHHHQARQMMEGINEFLTELASLYFCINLTTVAKWWIFTVIQNE